MFIKVELLQLNSKSVQAVYLLSDESDSRVLYPFYTTMVFNLFLYGILSIEYTPGPILSKVMDSYGCQ